MLNTLTETTVNTLLTHCSARGPDWLYSRPVCCQSPPERFIEYGVARALKLTVIATRDRVSVPAGLLSWARCIAERYPLTTATCRHSVARTHDSVLVKPESQTPFQNLSVTASAGRSRSISGGKALIVRVLIFHYFW